LTIPFDYDRIWLQKSERKIKMSEYPEPSGEIVTREYGATTFKQCGWCKYATGMHRYNYCISGNCRLQKNSYSDDYKIHWDDKCYFLTASQSDILNLIKYHEFQIQEAERGIERRNGNIKVLKRKIADAPKRPDLPDNRSSNHFKMGKEIAVYLDEYKKWYFGRVAPGYRSGDGCVSYILRGIGPQSGSFWGCGVCTPIVMLKSEYDFFKKNPNEYKIWCERAYDKDFNGKKIEIAPIP